MARMGFYAVKNGNGGPAVYTTWAETEAAVKGFPNCCHKKFASREETEEWINTPELFGGKPM